MFQTKQLGKQFGRASVRNKSRPPGCGVEHQTPQFKKIAPGERIRQSSSVLIAFKIKSQTAVMQSANFLAALRASGTCRYCTWNGSCIADQPTNRLIKSSLSLFRFDGIQSGFRTNRSNLQTVLLTAGQSEGTDLDIVRIVSEVHLTANSHVQSRSQIEIAKVLGQFEFDEFVLWRYPGDAF